LCRRVDGFVMLHQTAASCHRFYMGDSLNEEACVCPNSCVEGILSYIHDTDIWGLALLNTDGKRE
jgi:hypothetical protein